jgi:surfeit locus 1 family protein
MTRRMIAPLVFGILGVTVLVWLGVWQLQRLALKNALVSGIEIRLAAAPVAVPASPSPETDRYLHVHAEGEVEPGELHVYTSAPGQGVGYRVVVPLRLAGGRRILLDRGFVPVRDKDAPRLHGPIAVEGALAWPRETDSFTSPPDREKNVWFARDVPLMAEALATDPVLLVTASSDDPGQPTPLPVAVDIPNNHLGYAIQWFGMAAVWALMTGYLLWRIKRRID